MIDRTLLSRAIICNLLKFLDNRIVLWLLYFSMSRVHHVCLLPTHIPWLLHVVYMPTDSGLLVFFGETECRRRAVANHVVTTGRLVTVLVRMNLTAHRRTVC